MSFDLNYEAPKIIAEIGCNHMGEMSIAKELIDMGYSNVFNLKGGLNGWKSEGYDVIDAPLE